MKVNEIKTIPDLKIILFSFFAGRSTGVPKGFS